MKVERFGVAFVGKEQSFAIGEVPAGSRERMMGEGGRYHLQSVCQVVVSNELLQKSLGMAVSAKA